ncbi:DNA (cytosine-5-)-methyltransferase [Moorena bouillonii]|uniref:DNA (cytosine-5-)-methyltransferase n=1 Tax=Moorena bouillonii TaxID=207920 RepID=UPI0009D6A48B|nr:DNA (cytosine-5-)-methyltransferase [Moorena bouillonii]
MANTKSATGQDLVTVQEAAEILGVSSDTIRRWEKKKLLRAKRSERNYRFFDIEELKRIQRKYQGLATGVEFRVLKSKPTKFRVIELFAGCGGMALGFENAGLTTKLLVEIDKDCVNTLKLNRPSWKIIPEDIANVDFTRLLSEVGNREQGTGNSGQELTETVSENGVADSGYDSAPLAPQFWGEQNSESPPKLGDLGGLTKTRRSPIHTSIQQRPENYYFGKYKDKYKDNVEIVAGGVPCQAFSYAGLGKGFDDTRGTLFFEFARCVKEVQPKIALVENVRGLIHHDQGRTLSTMLRTLEDLGYNPTYKLLRAQFLDVAQKRERVIIIAVRKDLDLNAIFPKEKDYTISLREVLNDCPKSIGAQYPTRKREIMELIPPGGYWRNLPIELQKEYMKKSFYLGGGKTGMARRLSWEEPSLTLTCNPAQKQTERCHPEETRPLTVREYARIQSFPDDWEFTGSLSSRYRQIGNAVPVNLAYHIGRCLIAMLQGEFDPETMQTC